MLDVAGMLAPPAVDRQDQETENGFPATPLVADLFVVAELSVGPFHVVVGTHSLSRRTLQKGNHLGSKSR